MVNFAVEKTVMKPNPQKNCKKSIYRLSLNGMKALRFFALCGAASLILIGCRSKGAKEFNEITAEDLAAVRAENAVPADIPDAPEAVVPGANDTVKDESIGQLQQRAGADRIAVRNVGKLWETFNDSNYRQYEYAEALGIKPIRKLRDAYRTRRPMVMVESCSAYEVDKLTHSLPFLVPEGERLLNDIGRSFIDSLHKRGGRGYRIIATSLLRTPYTVRRLRRVNVNATDSSTHQFGTTFDLSYRRFHCVDSSRRINEEDLKNLLAEVLLDFRNRGRCLVKYEIKTGCFHVTATR